MPRPLTDGELLKVAKSKQSVILNLHLGAFLASTSGESLSDLQCRAVVARWQYADSVKSQGDSILGSTSPFYRLAVNRFYYAMYHFMRSVVFHDYGGDDFQEHSELPKKIPADFPERDEWQSNLKTARLARNNADYDPLPLAEVNWQLMANELQAQAKKLSTVSHSYLRGKGCKYL